MMYSRSILASFPFIAPMAFLFMTIIIISCYDGLYRPVSAITLVIYNSSDCSSSSLESNVSLSYPSVYLPLNASGAQCFNLSGLSGNTYDSNTWLQAINYQCSSRSLSLYAYSGPCSSDVSPPPRNTRVYQVQTNLFSPDNPCTGGAFCNEMCI